MPFETKHNTDATAIIRFREAFPNNDYVLIDANSAFEAIQHSMGRPHPGWAIVPTVSGLVAVAERLDMGDILHRLNPDQVCQIHQRWSDLHCAHLHLGVYVDGKGPFIYPDPAHALWQYRIDTTIWILHARGASSSSSTTSSSSSYTATSYHGMTRPRRSPRLARATTPTFSRPQTPRRPRTPFSPRPQTPRSPTPSAHARRVNCLSGARRPRSPVQQGQRSCVSAIAKTMRIEKPSLQSTVLGRRNMERCLE